MIKKSAGKILIDGKEIDVSFRLKESQLTSLGNHKYKAREKWVVTCSLGFAFGESESIFVDTTETGNSEGLGLRNAALDLVTYAAQKQAVNGIADIYRKRAV